MSDATVLIKKFLNANDFSTCFQSLTSAKLITGSQRRVPEARSHIPYSIYFPGEAHYYHNNYIVANTYMVAYMSANMEPLPGLVRILERNTFEELGNFPNKDVSYIGVLIPSLDLHLFFYRTDKFYNTSNQSFQYKCKNYMIIIKKPDSMSISQLQQVLNDKADNHGNCAAIKVELKKGFSGKTFCNMYEIPELPQTIEFHNNMLRILREQGDIALINVLMNDISDINTDIIGGLLR